MSAFDCYKCGRIIPPGFAHVASCAWCMQVKINNEGEKNVNKIQKEASSN